MMRIPKIINGRLQLPCFIFIKATGCLSDRDTLNLLGIGDFSSTPVGFTLSKPSIFITEDDTWIHIADSSYDLWNTGWLELNNRLHNALPTNSIFACSVGDIDWSFDFSYYTSGKLSRRFIVEDKGCDVKKRAVVVDLGSPLTGERNLSEISDELEYVLSVGAALGIKFDHQLERIRYYSKPD